MRLELLSASNRAALSLGDPNAIQAAPPLVENCHVPLLLLADVTAMPLRAASSASAMVSVAMKLATSVPLLVTSSSRMVGSAADVVFSTGALLMNTTTVLVMASLVAPAPSVMAKRTVRFSVDGL